MYMCVYILVYTSVVSTYAYTHTCVWMMQGMRMEEGSTEATELATYLLRVKEEDQANEFVRLIHQYKQAKLA